MRRFHLLRRLGAPCRDCAGGGITGRDQFQLRRFQAVSAGGSFTQARVHVTGVIMFPMPAQPEQVANDQFQVARPGQNQKRRFRHLNA